MSGGMKKRVFYFLSAVFRFVSFLGLLVAFISVKIANEPDIEWLNALLLVLSLTCLVTSLFNLALCGMPATGYKQRFGLQLVCFLVTLVTGGIFSSAFTGVAVFTRVSDEEVANENLLNVKTFKKGEKDEKTKV